MIDQLRYAWANHGLTGVGRLQPVAASSGLLNPQAKRHILATRLCRYDKAPGTSTTPISYGWLDSGENRFLFRREFLTDDQAGHPGNFAAHVLVAPADELTVSRCLALYHGSFWWHGPRSDDTVGEVPELDIHDLLGSTDGPRREDLRHEAVASPATEDLLTALLAEELAAQLTVTPDELMTAMHTVNTMLPGLLDSQSFSTYEAGRLARFFTIHGSPSPDRVPRESPARTEARTAARALLFNTRFPTTVTHTLWAGYQGSEGSPVKAFRRLVSAVDVSIQGSATNVDAVLPALGTPECAGQLFEFTEIRDAVARALVRGGPVEGGRARIVRSLCRSGTRIQADAWDAFDQTAMGVLEGNIPDSDLCAALDQLPSSHALPRIATRLLQRAETGSFPTQRWPMLLLLAALQDPTPLRDQNYAHAIRTVAPHLTRWASCSELARQQQIDLLAEYVHTGRVPEQEAVRTLEPAFRDLISSNPDVITPITAELTSSPYIGGVIRDQVAQSAHRAGTLSAAHLDVLHSTFDGTSPSAADLTVIMKLCTGVRLPPGWGELVASLLLRHAERVLSEPYAPHVEDLRRLVESARGTAIRPLLSAIDTSRSVRTLEHHLQELPLDQAGVLRRFYVDRTISMGYLDSDHTARLFDLLSSADGVDSAAVCLLIAAQRGMRLYGRSLSCHHVFVALGESYPDAFVGTKKVSRRIRAQPRSRTRLHGLAAHTFSLLSHTDPQYAESVVEHFTYGRPNRAWIKFLVGQSSDAAWKAERKEGGVGRRRRG
ncbi:hypothetical protein [Leekyejoonella antrihumi]|uniref:GTPase-associated protein 1 N-terminal domain-containing protein n=1 Tax=Leekyejoonella antrihumi TaxID=1660198 RepID=A0A563DRZ1_9MICO|nr:hypothetical protein [Leekyejoonella antrihumi]TWP32995.1 hypothetical protein FGL98_22635 [Leekyejoonella antrihumi]